MLYEQLYFLADPIKVIVLAYFGLYLVTSGILYFIGFLIPHVDATPYEKAKKKIYLLSITFPLVLFILFVGYISIGGDIWKSPNSVLVILPIILIPVYVAIFILSINTLKTFRKNK